MSIHDIMTPTEHLTEHTRNHLRGYRGKLAIPAPSTTEEVKWATVCIPKWKRILKWTHAIAFGLGNASIIALGFIMMAIQGPQPADGAEHAKTTPTTVASANIAATPTTAPKP